MKKGPDKRHRKLERDRELSRHYVANFTRIAQAALRGGGSTSFEWPRGCSGWKEPCVIKMRQVLNMQPVDIDGCAAGAMDSAGTPMLKPWRFLVSSQHLADALHGLRCARDHEHRTIAGGALRHLRHSILNNFAGILS